MSDHPENLPFLQVKQVSLAASSGSNYLLQDISFAVARGERLVIVGASGAGKTSLLRLLNRLNNPSQGSIILDNQDYNQISSLKLRQQVVLVPQETKLLGMTVKETLAYPLVLQKLAKTEIQQRLITWINQLHLAEEWLDRNELQLSVGQKQLVGITRALMMQPKILLLDEPTSALDAGRAAHLLATLRELANVQETTIIMVNHHLELAQQFASRVLYLQDGKLLEDTLATNLDWHKLKDNLVKAEAEAAQGWL